MNLIPPTESQSIVNRLREFLSVHVDSESKKIMEVNFDIGAVGTNFRGELLFAPKSNPDSLINKYDKGEL